MPRAPLPQLQLQQRAQGASRFMMSWSKRSVIWCSRCDRARHGCMAAPAACCRVDTRLPAGAAGCWLACSGGRCCQQHPSRRCLLLRHATQVHVACDNARYECDAPPALAFRPTVMFATRAHVIRLANTGQARLDYAWRVLYPDGSEDASGAASKGGARGRALVPASTGARSGECSAAAGLRCCVTAGKASSGR